MANTKSQPVATDDESKDSLVRGGGFGKDKIEGRRWCAVALRFEFAMSQNFGRDTMDVIWHQCQCHRIFFPVDSGWMCGISAPVCLVWV